jgi:hypothetical protein
MDFLFLIIIGECGWEFKWFLIPATAFMVSNLIFPIFQLIKMTKMKKTSADLTMPYMEAINFLSFLRENMLLATVVDSFCLNNTKHFFKKSNGGEGVRVVFGRLMGGLSFFL